ncbi:hypothetical protein [Spirosoma sp.]|uniref:hypothetical protein n=1 Tax=Spirosoma sp. TaxID=1899569 RepID=UPI00262D5552|nr:hypothetical protein [Spirosoma sp.]MCX6218693.1 hypothetical protein [Spirosoma sp.]
MQTLLNKSSRAFCPYAQLPIEALTDEQLYIRRSKTRQMLVVVICLMLLVVMMAFVVEQYFLMATSAGMIPALDDYEKKRKAIANQLRKRNLR